MSTNATINVVNANGSVKSIYLHWDGDSAGKTLVENYTTQDKVDALMKLGNLSSLGAVIGTKHDFDSRDIDVCTAYGRDRGENGQAAEEFKTLAEFNKDGGGLQYNYLFNNGEWTVGQYSNAFKEDYK